jgi:putative transposase
MKLADGVLRLSNGRQNDPLVLLWEWELPQTVVIHWTGTAYEALATSEMGESLAEQEEQDIEDKRAEHTTGIDLGEVHLAVSHDGERSHLLNGRLLRSKKQERNKLIAKMDQKISRTKEGSKRRKQLIRAREKTAEQSETPDPGYRTQANQLVGQHAETRGRREAGHWGCERYQARTGCRL